MNILHLIDDNKFIESSKATFNVKGVINFFLEKGKASEQYIIDNKIDVVVLHYLTLADAKFVIKCTLNIKYIWFFWGADGFSFGKYYNNFLLEKTRKVRLRNEFSNSFSSGIKCLIKSLFPSIIDKSSTSQIMLSAIEKIDVVVPVVPLDFELLREDYSLKNKMFHVNYLTPFFFNNKEVDNPQFTTGRSILLGNSSSYTNNHIEAIDVIKKQNQQNRPIVIPLNYGDKNYASYVSNYAQKELGKDVRVLEEFLDFDEYVKIMNSVGILVMNHCRQQAVGNIVMGLLTGKTVYLRKGTTVYKFLISKGFHVKTFDTMEGDFEEYDYNVLLDNYHKAYAVFGTENIHERVERLLKEVSC